MYHSQQALFRSRTLQGVLVIVQVQVQVIYYDLFHAVSNTLFALGCHVGAQLCLVHNCMRRRAMNEHVIVTAVLISVRLRRAPADTPD